MAESFQNVAQVLPSQQTLTDMYTVPALTQLVGSSLVICNQSSLAASFRVAHAIAGAADSAKQYLYLDQIIPANQTFIVTIGLTMNASDILRVLSSNGLMSFNLYGDLIT